MEQPFVKHTSRLQAGDTAPEFTAFDQNGNSVSSAHLRGKRLVLFFYPKDSTPTCTQQACSLRDGFARLRRKGYTVLGVSGDTAQSHARFATKNALPFPLLADVDLKICKDYDVYGKKLFFGRVIEGIVRTTFLIAGDGCIHAVLREVNSKDHAAQVLQAWEQ